MGFSFKKMFSGSGWRKFKRTVGGVAKLAVGVVPGVGGLAGKLLTSGVGRTAVKGIGAFKKGRSVMRQLAASPVMPGGAVSTPGGMQPPMIVPPSDYGGSRSVAGIVGRKRRKRKATTTTRRRKRKLKFGSPAWRAKYQRKRRKRRA